MRRVRYHPITKLMVALSVLALSALSVAPSGAVEPEGAGNNLSVPVIWAEGATSLPQVALRTPTVPTGDWGADPDDTAVVQENGADVTVWLQQRVNNVWQADNQDAPDTGPALEAVVDWVDWGDSLGSAPPSLEANRPARVETVLYQETPGLTGYEMYLVANPMSPDEMQGTDQSTYVTGSPDRTGAIPWPTVYSPCARLTIQGPLPVGTYDWDPLEHRWIGTADTPTPQEVVNLSVLENPGEGPGGYGAEINVGGKVLYGYNWFVSQAGQNNGPGRYRLTFSLDGTTADGSQCDGLLNTDLSQAEILVSAEEGEDGPPDGMGAPTVLDAMAPPGGGATEVLDPIHNLSYVDVTVTGSAGADVTAPAIDLRTPPTGAVYRQGAAVLADYSCADEPGGSGLRSCVGTVPDGSLLNTSASGTYTFSVTATDNNGNDRTVVHTYRVSSYTALSPSRLLDTRIGIGAPVGPVPGGSTIDVQVTGRADVPRFGVEAVVLNVTSTEATLPSFVTVWPTGETMPLASTLNTDPGTDTPNLTIAKVGAGGKVSFYNNSGSTHLVADVMGWFATGSDYEGLTPARLLDTRVPLGAGLGPVVGGSTIDLQVTGRGGVPGTGVGAVVLNVTSTEAANPAYVTVWPTGESMPLASTLNTDPGTDTPNLTIAKVGTGGQVSLYYSLGTGHLVADVVGWFPTGSEYTSLVPARVLDTRTANGVATAGPLSAGQTIELQVTGRGNVPATGVGAVVLNVTTTQATAPSYLTVWPPGEARPVASNLNTDPGTDTPNLVIAKVGSAGRVAIYNNAGTTHVVADVVGWFPA